VTVVIVNFLLNIFSFVASVEWTSPQKIVARRHCVSGQALSTRRTQLTTGTIYFVQPVL